MKVADDSRSRGPAKIHPEVETLRMVRVLKRLLHPLRKDHHFGKASGIGTSEIARVRIGNDHDVAAGVRVPIENDEILFGAKDDKRLRIVVGLKRAAENAPVVLGGVRDI